MEGREPARLARFARAEDCERLRRLAVPPLVCLIPFLLHWGAFWLLNGQNEPAFRLSGVRWFYTPARITAITVFICFHVQGIFLS